MAGGILALAECRGGRPTRSSLEGLSAARELQTLVPGKRVSVVVGAGVSELAGDLAGRGADEVMAFDDPELARCTTEVHARALGAAIVETEPELVLLPDSAYGRDVGARVAARLNVGLATGCGRFFTGQDGTLAAERAVFGGRLLERVAWRNAPRLATLRTGAWQAPARDASRAVRVVRRSVDAQARARVVSVDSGSSTAVQRPDIEEARVIVSAGRGIGAAGNLRLVEDLADALGAAVGASRAVVDLGWLDHQHQIGQTGRSVAPSVYLACGIHGATQHLAGISAARTIVVVNRDREAPIFSVADYGIVGDVETVLPSLIAELRNDPRQGPGEVGE